MDLTFGREDEAFRADAREWLTNQLSGPFADVRGRGGPGDEHECYEERLAWERALGEAGWIGLGWPTEVGGRGGTRWQRVIWHEEYARAQGPGRLGHIGEMLVGPTIIAFGTNEQQKRFLPGILDGTELWCQGYSEPDAGSDLANVATKAVRDEDGDWRLYGQKVWTSLAHWAQWCFLLARTKPSAPKHRGLSYLLVPMDQRGIEVRPIRQATGTSEFNELFFEGARASADDVVGDVDGGWRVAMGTLAFERGESTLGQQLSFANELAAITDVARANGRIDDPTVRQRLARAWTGLQLQRWTALRVLSGDQSPGPVATVTKLFWATWHRELGNLAMDVAGSVDAAGAELQRLFVFTRADTIYGGSNQIQRNIIGERALGLPREPNP